MGPSRTMPEEAKRHPAASLLLLLFPTLAYLLVIPFPVATAAGRTIFAVIQVTLSAFFLLFAFRFSSRP